MISTVAIIGSVGWIGTASLVSHLAWMYGEQRTRVLAADYDQFGTLTARFLGDERAEALLDGEPTIDRAGISWMVAPTVQQIDERLAVVCGAPQSATTPVIEAGPIARAMLAGWAEQAEAELVLVYASGVRGLAELAVQVADHVVVVIAPNVFSLRALHTLSLWPALRARARGYVVGFSTRPGPESAGATRGGWSQRMASAYADVISHAPVAVDPRHDPSCLGVLRNYRSLISIAEEARKPLFKLTPADGAMGSHLAAARQAYDDFSQLADRIADATWRRKPA